MLRPKRLPLPPLLQRLKLLLRPQMKLRSRGTPPSPRRQFKPLTLSLPQMKLRPLKHPPPLLRLLKLLLPKFPQTKLQLLFRILKPPPLSLR